MKRYRVYSPKDTNFLTGNKTAGNKTEAEKIANPFGIFGIIFVAFNSFYPFRISNGNVDLVFQEIKNGIQYLPVDSIQTSKQELSRPTV